MSGIVNVFPGGVASVLDVSAACVVLPFGIDDEILSLAFTNERKSAESAI